MKILKKFFQNSDGNFIVPYFWATITLTLFVIAVVFKLVSPKLSLDALIATLAGVSGAMIAIYNQGKKK